jgi:hypothetical protein
MKPSTVKDSDPLGIPIAPGQLGLIVDVPSRDSARELASWFVGRERCDTARRTNRLIGRVQVGAMGQAR